MKIVKKKIAILNRKGLFFDSEVYLNLPPCSHLTKLYQNFKGVFTESFALFEFKNGINDSIRF